ncbi:heterocycloanthracin/sonorensin family bacteriocin [Aneurinibacillus sp. Ricciae_BoGa-3]|uniref:heterocycloanthracin/sonorensin family bacteriocin n=1 Tax=Aneurinibacillus sp. Ricciae_BoGa-3 TaxID=3022697 RepID=UPI003FA4B555
MEVIRVDDFKNDLQGLNVGNFEASQMMPFDPVSATNSDQARQCGRCFHCSSCFRCSNCFNCFRCFSCFRCF